MGKTAGILSDIASLIKKSRTIFISGHLRPDGDTAGSQLALLGLLQRYKKKVFICNAEAVPQNLRFLPGVEHIKALRKCPKNFDLAIILECSDVDRMGNIIDIKKQAKYSVNIDHHLSHSNFADVNYVDKNASSSAEQVWNLFCYLGVEPNYNEALCLYTGILTDTGCFQHSNTNSGVLRIASKLLTKGIKPDWLYEQIYQHKPLSSIKLIGYVLNNFKLYFGGRAALIALPKGSFAGALRDSEEIISYLLMTDSVKVGIFVRQVGDEVRASFRSKGTLNVAKAAEVFGGGGHRNAAGLSLYRPMNESIKLILKEIKKIF